MVFCAGFACACVSCLTCCYISYIILCWKWPLGGWRSTISVTEHYWQNNPAGELSCPKVKTRKKKLKKLPAKLQKKNRKPKKRKKKKELANKPDSSLSIPTPAISKPGNSSDCSRFFMKWISHDKPGFSRTPSVRIYLHMFCTSRGETHSWRLNAAQTPYLCCGCTNKTKP